MKPMGRAAQAARPRPRMEGKANPTVPVNQASPYPDGSRVVPKKLGFRAAAAKKLQTR
jgi:hypothetical protein